MLPVDILSGAQTSKSLGNKVSNHSLYTSILTLKFWHMRPTRQITEPETTTVGRIRIPCDEDYSLCQRATILIWQVGELCKLSEK